MKRFYKNFLMLVLALMCFSQAWASNIVVDGNEYVINGDGATVTLRAFVGNPDTLKCYVIPDMVEYEGKTYPVTMLDFYQGLSEIDLDEIYVGRNLQYMLYDSFYSNSVRHVVWNARNCEMLDVVTTGAPAKKSISRGNAVEPKGFGGIQTDRLEEIVIGDEVKLLPPQFAQGAIIKSLRIPASLADINTDSFCGCEELKAIMVDAANPLFDSRDNCNGVVRTADNALVMACTATRIPASVSAIGTYAYCTLSTKSVVLPSSIKKINNAAFGNCGELEKIESHVVDPSDVELGTASFYGVPVGTCVLYVPKGSAELYRTASQWQSFRHILEMDEEPTPAKGDLNGDGRVDVEDVNALINIILKLDQE